MGLRLQVLAVSSKPRDNGGEVNKLGLLPASTSILGTKGESQAWEWKNCCNQRSGDEGKADLQDRVWCKSDCFKKTFEFLVQPMNDGGITGNPTTIWTPTSLASRFTKMLCISADTHLVAFASTPKGIGPHSHRLHWCRNLFGDIFRLFPQLLKMYHWVPFLVGERIQNWLCLPIHTDVTF